jgi:hypothetical protein
MATHERIDTHREPRVLVPLRTARALVPPTSSFRSTWLSSSLRALRERGHLDAYLAKLPEAYHALVLAPVVGVWLPDEVAVAHYRACDALNLPPAEAFAIGYDVARHAQQTLLSTAATLAKAAGVTPWTLLSQMQKLWTRIWNGGDLTVLSLGPKEARLEIVGWTSARIPYCRIAMRGVLQGMLDMFCRRGYVTEWRPGCSDTSLAYRIAWV